MSSKTVSIPSISCGHCVATIEREIGALAGVQVASADQTSGIGLAKYLPNFSAVRSMMRRGTKAL